MKEPLLPCGRDNHLGVGYRRQQEDNYLAERDNHSIMTTEPSEVVFCLEKSLLSC